MEDSEKPLMSKEDFKKLVNNYLTMDDRITDDMATIAALLDIIILKQLNSDKVLVGILKDISNNTDRIALAIEPVAEKKDHEELQQIFSDGCMQGLNAHNAEIDQLKKDVEKLKGESA